MATILGLVAFAGVVPIPGSAGLAECLAGPTPGEPVPEPGEVVGEIEEARDDAEATAGCVRHEAAVDLPIITFHGAGFATHCTDGSGLLPEGCYPDAGSLEGTLDLATGDVTLVFKGLGTVSCSDGDGNIIVPGILPVNAGCYADIDPQDLECYAYMVIWSDDPGVSSRVEGFGVCTAERIEV